MITLKNDCLKVDILEKGAEIRSVLGANGTQFMWDANPDVWAQSAPVMFPVCGGLRDDKYILNGKEYTLGKHGFAKLCDFEVIGHTDEKAVFCLRSNEESKKCFPFDYDFTITYTLVKNSIYVSYEVLNRGNDTMYFSFGGHEAYACPEGIEEYSVVFAKNVTLKSLVLNGNLLEYKTNTVLENSNKLDLKEDFFAIDALVFDKVDFNKATLVHRNSSKKITVNFEGFKTFMLWTRPNGAGKYICLEPWCNAPDFVDSDYDFTKKDGVMALNAYGSLSKTHKITFEE